MKFDLRVPSGWLNLVKIAGCQLFIFLMYAGTGYARTAPEIINFSKVVSNTANGGLPETYLSSQQVELIVKGKVTSEKGEPLSGVSVILENSTTGAVTDRNGEYSVNLPGSKGVLIFAFIGFIRQEIPVNGRNTIDIELKSKATDLNEVVVVGYGTQKKISTTSSISSVKGGVLAQAPVANISNSLAGNVAGLSMRPNGGQPGSDAPDIHLRGIATTGNNQPLIVVDGIIRSNINQIDPASIETVTVLKDAAAVAPYGLGGANGVILITTKKGKSGAPVFSLNAYYGRQTPTYYPKMLNAQDYMRLHNEAYLNENPTGTDLPYATDLISNYTQLNARDPDRYPNSNARSIVNMSSPIQNYSMQLSGGNERTKYFTSLGFLKQEGMFSPVNYSRYNYSVSLETQATKTTTVSVSIIGSIENTNSVDASSSASSLFNASYKYVPTASLTYSNGLWGEFAGESPIGILKAGYLRSTNNTLLTTLGIEQKLPVKGLSIKGTLSYDPNQITIKSWHTPFYFYSEDLSTTPYTFTRQISTSEGGSSTYSWLNEEYSKNQNFTYQGYLNYHNTFGKNDITGLVVAEARNNTYEDFSARRNNFAVGVDELNMGSSNKNDLDNSGTSSTGSQLGYVYRLAYGYDNKYLVEASGRYDEHYYFAPGKRWGYFPAFSVGWVLSQEEYFKKAVPFVDYLKIRGSWGKSGNLAGSPYQYENGYSLYGNSYAFGSGSMVSGTYIAQQSNPNITWEISTKQDLGFESRLWNGLLTVEADYFHEKRNGMLLPPAVSVPVEYGLALSQENEGIMSNQGFELTLGSSWKFENGLHAGLTGNMSYARNKMLQIFETSATRDNPNRSRTGRPFGEQFGYHTLGLFSTKDDKNGDGIIDAADGYNVSQFGVLHPGDIRYADISGPNGKPDGVIDANDETVIGNPIYPLLTYGFTPTASWKGFDISLFFQGSAISSINTEGYRTVPFNNNNSNSSYQYYDNRWTPTHQDALYPRADQAPTQNNTQVSDFWVKNSGFIRLKTGVLGYTVPLKVTGSMKIKSVRFYFSGQNIFTLSKLRYMDPEEGYTNQTTAYPNQKVYTFGLNATF